MGIEVAYISKRKCDRQLPLVLNGNSSSPSPPTIYDSIFVLSTSDFNSPAIPSDSISSRSRIRAVTVILCPFATWGAQNPHHVPPGWTPPTSVTPQPQSAVNYSLKATVTKSTPSYCDVNLSVDDSRWRFKDPGMLPNPRPYKGIIKEYKSGRKTGSTIPLDLNQFA